MMIEQIKKGVLAGIELGLMTNEKILEFARKSAEDAHLSREEARELADELLKQSDKTRKDLEDKIDEHIKRQIDRLGFATKDDVEELKKEILKLNKKVKEVSG